MKEESWDRDIGPHPIFAQYMDISDKDIAAKEQIREDLLYKLKNLKPKCTIFEFYETKKVIGVDTTMELKRARDQKYIEKFHEKVLKRKTEKEEKEISNSNVSLF